MGSQPAAATTAESSGAAAEAAAAAAPEPTAVPAAAAKPSPAASSGLCPLVHVDGGWSLQLFRPSRTLCLRDLHLLRLRQRQGALH